MDWPLSGGTSVGKLSNATMNQISTSHFSVNELSCVSNVFVAFLFSQVSAEFVPGKSARVYFKRAVTGVAGNRLASIETQALAGSASGQRAVLQSGL